jgi:hypothetical protein
MSYWNVAAGRTFPSASFACAVMVTTLVPTCAPFFGTMMCPLVPTW